MTAEIAPAERHVPKRPWSPLALAGALLVLAGGGCVLVGWLGATWLTAHEGWLYWATLFDVFNNFLPIWAVLIALGLLVALTRKRRSTPLIAAATVLLVMALVPIGLELRGAPERVEYSPGISPARSIRILQFNALSVNDDLGAALDMALGADADLIMVEEPLRFRRLEPYLKLRYPFATPCPRDCEAIIYSRLPPLSVDYTTLRGRWYREKYTVGNGPIGVASIRLAGPDGAPFTALATHFRWPFPPMPVMHQRDVFIDHLAKLDRTRAIVAGDFNLTPWTFEMRGLDRGAEPMQRVTRALFSWPVPFKSTLVPLPMPILPIDHVYAGSRWKLVSARRGPPAGSDHYPVIVELVMPGPSAGG